MISAELGVTVAAVYHQYHTKDEIIFAAVESQLRRLKDVVDAAESEPTTLRAREALITGIVELAIGVGGSITMVLNDPAVTGSFSRHGGYRELLRRIRSVLMGEANTKESRIQSPHFWQPSTAPLPTPLWLTLTMKRYAPALNIAHRLVPRNW